MNEGLIFIITLIIIVIFAGFVIIPIENDSLNHYCNETNGTIFNERCYVNGTPINITGLGGNKNG